LALKLFRIKKVDEGTHQFTHQKAVEKDIIRALAFEELNTEPKVTSLASAFATTWKKAKTSGKLPAQAPRAITKSNWKQTA
jgi:hypothetical protein